MGKEETQSNMEVEQKRDWQQEEVEVVNEVEVGVAEGKEEDGDEDDDGERDDGQDYRGGGGGDNYDDSDNDDDNDGDEDDDDHDDDDGDDDDDDDDDDDNNNDDDDYDDSDNYGDDYDDGEDDDDDDDGDGDGDGDGDDDDEDVDDDEEDDDYRFRRNCFWRPMKKKKLKDLPDRIGKLPESVITRILSFMSTRDAVRTSVLAKRWRYSWTSIFSLIYLYESSKGSLQEFTTFINRTMVLNNSSAIDKFVLKSLYKGFMEPSVTCWVQAALSKQLDQLTLKFRNTSPPYFVLPQSIYECNSLTVLSISHCCIAPTQSSFFWRALKHLCAELSNNLLQELLAGSPLLESLKLKNCTVFDNIDINSGRLKRMVINGYGSCRCNYRETKDDGLLVINAPNLLFLEIKGYMNSKRCRLKNVSSLAHAKLTFWLGCREYEGRVQDCQNMVRDLMEKVSFAENLTVGSWLIQVLSTCELKHLLIFSSIRKRLVMETYLCGQDLPGIDALLQTSPVIEQLIIDVSPSHVQVSDFEELRNINGTNYWNTQRMVVSHCLKTIKILGFSKPVIELVKFLLENATALEHMIFCKSSGFANGRRCNFGQEGHSFKNITELVEVQASLTSS